MRQRLRARVGAPADVQQWLAHLDCRQGQRAQVETLAIGQDQQADQASAMLCHVVQINPHQGLAGTHLLAFLHQQGKPLALQFDSVQAQVQQQFGPIGGAQGDCVPGTCDLDHLAGAGRMQGVVEGIDGDAVAHGTAGEHRVGHAA